MKKIFIGGIQGVGKTTISKSISEKNNTIGRFSFGEKIYEIANREIQNYKGIQFLSDNDRFRIIEIAKKQLQEIMSGQKYEKLLFDNHFTIVRKNKIENTFKDEDIQLYDQIVLLQASASEIKKRILNDPIKERIQGAHNISFIKKHQKIEQERAHLLSMKYGIDIITILNNDLNTTIQEIEDFII